MSLIARPGQGRAVRYRCTLGELTSLPSLPGWPPPELLDDPAVQANIRAAKGLLNKRGTDLRTLELHSPQPLVAWCLGHPRMSSDGSAHTLSLFVFPTRQPDHQGRAIAQVMIKFSEGTIDRAWIDALDDEELSSENRSDIRALLDAGPPARAASPQKPDLPGRAASLKTKPLHPVGAPMQKHLFEEFLQSTLVANDFTGGDAREIFAQLVSSFVPFYAFGNIRTLSFRRASSTGRGWTVEMDGYGYDAEFVENVLLTSTPRPPPEATIRITSEGAAAYRVETWSGGRHLLHEIKNVLLNDHNEPDGLPREVPMATGATVPHLPAASASRVQAPDEGEIGRRAAQEEFGEDAPTPAALTPSSVATTRSPPWSWLLGAFLAFLVLVGGGASLLTRNSKGDPTPASVAPVAEAEPQPASVPIVVKKTCNLRAGPGTSNAVIGKATPRSTCTQQRLSEGWYRVVCDSGVEGWLSGTCVDTTP